MSATRDGVLKKRCWQLGGCCAPIRGVVRASLLMKTVAGWCAWEGVAMSSADSVYKVITLGNVNQMEGTAQALQEAADHLLLTPPGLPALGGTKQLPWPSASPQSRAPSVAHPRSVTEAACTWCARAAPAISTGAGCARRSGRGSAWGHTGLASQEAAGVYLHQGVLSSLINFVQIHVNTFHNKVNITIFCLILFITSIVSRLEVASKATL